MAIASVVAVFGAARSLLGRRPASESAFRTIAEQETVHKKSRSGTRWLRIGVAVAVLATLTTVATPVSAADGDLDTSFDSDGMRKVDLHASGEDGIYHIAVEDDGDVMFSGYWNNNGQANKYSWYQQLKNPDGTSAGLSNPSDRLFWSPKADVIRETLIQSDGRYVSVGYAGTVTTGSGGDYDCAVIRRMPVDEAGNDGELDTSFSGNGKLFVTFSGSSNDYCTSGALQSDGKIVVGGWGPDGGNDKFLLARIDTDGTLDTTFGGNDTGMMTTSLCDVMSDCGSGVSSALRRLEIQPDGKIVVGGSYDTDGADTDFVVARYTTDGDLDTTFSSDGIHAFDLGSGTQDQLRGMKLQPNGKIVVVGYNDAKDWAVARLNTDGSMDTTFGGGDGITITDFGGTTDRAQDLVIESDGKIVVGGFTDAGSDFDFAVARYTTSGDLDTTFSSDGKTTTDVNGDGHDDRAYGIAIADNGNVILAGTSDGGGDADWAIAQYDSSTGPDGSITMTAFGKFRKDDEDSTIATHEDPNVTAVPGGYGSDDTRNSNHEKANDYVVNGTDRTFSLVLGTQPTSDVVVDFSVGSWSGNDLHAAASTSLGTDLVIEDSGETTVTSATFTNGNWNSSQTFTVVPAQDGVVEGVEQASIVVTVDQDASDDLYDTVSAISTDVVIWDDDHNVTSGFDYVAGAVDGLSLKGFPSEVVYLDYMEPGEQYLIDPNDGVGVRWYCIDPTALATAGGDVGDYIGSLGEAGVWASQLWIGNNIDHDGNTSWWRSQFANKNWTSLSNFDFSSHTTAVQQYVWGSDGKLRWNDDSGVANGETSTACPLDDQLYFGSAARHEKDKDAVPASQITIRPGSESAPTTTLNPISVNEGSSVVIPFALGISHVVDETVTFSSPYSGATFTPNSLTFTNDDYATGQNLTLAIADNDLEEGTSTTSTITWSGFGTSGTINYTIVDNDTAAFTLSTTTASVSEAGSTATFTVVLDTQPTSDVVLTVASGDTGEATVSPSTLTFTNANWNATQTVTITGVDDSVDDGDQNTMVTIAVDDDNSDNAFDGLADQTVTATTTDDDTAAFTLSTTTASVSEAGSTATFTVVLDTQPTSDVVLTVASADTGEATVSPSTLTFTNANWNATQTVTITGVDDLVDDGDQDTMVTIAVDDDNSDNAFDGIADQTVTAATTDDDDTAGYTLSGTAATVTESGSTATFTVVLDGQPTSDVVLTVASADTGEATVSPSTLTFTNANWSATQTVTITGVDDAAADGPQDTAVTIAVDDDNSDNAFDGLADQTVTATTTDDDSPGLSVSQSDASTLVDETGSTDSFTVVLTTQPLSDVVVAALSADTGEATVSTSTLTFTAANWSTPQVVTVMGVDDSVVDGDQDTAVTIAVDDDNSDNAFDGIADQTVTATTTDDDTAAFTLSTTTVSVTEAGSTDTFTVVLDTQPLSDVVFMVVSADTGEATVSAPTLTFTNANWNATQTVTITGVDDSVDDGDQNTKVTIAVDDDNSDNAFDGIAYQTVTATTADDDTAAFTLSTTTVSVTEAGSTDTFTVVLDTQPLSDVVVAVSSADTSEAKVSAPTLTFTSSSWNVPQSVTITGVDDSIVDGNQDTAVTIAVDDDNSDNAFDGIADQTATATTTDNDGSVSTPGAPSAVLAVAGPQSALVTWEAPTSDGGATVTAYQLDYSPDSGTTWTTSATDAATLSLTVEGLTAGSEYVFRVSATNSVGTGDTSVASTAVTVGYSIAVGYDDDLYAALLEAGDAFGDTSESFQRRAIAIADFYLALPTSTADPMGSTPDTNGPNTITSTYTAAEYDDWVTGTATGFNVDETSGQYMASYLLLFLLTQVTG